jgi:hypothetical protein
MCGTGTRPALIVLKKLELEEFHKSKRTAQHTLVVTRLSAVQFLLFKRTSSLGSNFLLL